MRYCLENFPSYVLICLKTFLSVYYSEKISRFDYVFVLFVCLVLGFVCLFACFAVFFWRLVCFLELLHSCFYLEKILLMSDKSCIILQSHWESISQKKRLSKHRKVWGLNWTSLCYSPKLKMLEEHWQGRVQSAAAREALVGFWDFYINLNLKTFDTDCNVHVHYFFEEQIYSQQNSSHRL